MGKTRIINKKIKIPKEKEEKTMKLKGNFLGGFKSVEVYQEGDRVTVTLLKNNKGKLSVTFISDGLFVAKTQDGRTTEVFLPWTQILL
ncbi:MAG: hypothetical protein QMD86_01700 [Patescibacteria group bacterium]|nr:hypothetical protein [Patescibacteria group bacterium]